MEEIIKILSTLFSELKAIKVQMLQLNKNRLKAYRESWLDGQDVMQLLHISPRTLQTYRNNGILPFSQIRGKIYYKFSDIEKILDSNYSTKKTSTHETK